MTNLVVMVITLSTIACVFTAPNAMVDEYKVSEKRAAFVLDRLLVALQHALHDDKPDSTRSGELKSSPLRMTSTEYNDMSALQRRGQSNSGRGRVLRCYFNAITCF